MQRIEETGKQRRRHPPYVRESLITQIPLKGTDIPPVSRQGIVRQSSYDPQMVAVPFGERIQR